MESQVDLSVIVRVCIVCVSAGKVGLSVSASVIAIDRVNVNELVSEWVSG